MDAVRPSIEASGSAFAARGGGPWGGEPPPAPGWAAPQRPQYRSGAPNWFPHWLQNGICYFIRYAMGLCSRNQIQGIGVGGLGMESGPMGVAALIHPEGGRGLERPLRAYSGSRLRSIPLP